MKRLPKTFSSPLHQLMLFISSLETNHPSEIFGLVALIWCECLPRYLKLTLFGRNVYLGALFLGAGGVNFSAGELTHWPAVSPN